MNLYATLFASSVRRATAHPRTCTIATRGLLSFALRPAAVWPRPLLGTLRPFTASPFEVSRPQPSIVQFALSKAWGATHRSRIAASGRRNSWTPPPPQGPWQQFIRWLDSIPSNVIFWGVLGVNGAVFCAWQLATAIYVCRLRYFHMYLKNKPVPCVAK
jgi:rhomboid-like protein